MSKILITESQLKKLIKSGLLKEAELGGYETVSGGTNKSPVTHRGLTQFGLIPGNYEGYNFKTTFGELFTLSKGPITGYLSSFKPNQNIGGYSDFISIGDVEYNAGDPLAVDANNNSTYKAGTFLSGALNESDEVVASHNGLLAIKRFMEKMAEIEKMPSTASVVFGSEFEDKKAASAGDAQRIRGATTVSVPQIAYNITPELASIAQLMVCYLDIEKKSEFCNKNLAQSNNLYPTLTLFINKVVSGFKYLPQNQQEQYAASLSKVGFIREVNIPEIRTVFETLITNKNNSINTRDMTNPEVRRINDKVIQRILSLIDEKIKLVQQTVVKYYIDNFKIYINTYFRGDTEEEMSKIGALNATIFSAKTAYDGMFNKTIYQQAIKAGEIKQTSEVLPKLGVPAPAPAPGGGN